MELIPLFKTGQEIILQKDSRSAKSTLRGWRIGQYLLVDTPDISWTGNQTEPIIGRLLGGATYYGFTTGVVGLFREVSLLALRYPDDIVDNSDRKYSRFNTTIPVDIIKTDKSGEINSVGAITNISEGGCQLVCQDSYKIDEKLYLRLNFSTGSRIEKIGCILRSVTKVNNKFNCGVQFDIIDDDEMIPLKEFLNIVSEYNIPDHG